MSGDDDLIALIDFIYAAVLDGNLWPTVLTKLADTTGTMDGRTNSFDSISRRTIAELDASYKNYWAFRNPLWAKIAGLPTGALYSLDSLMPPKTDIFNEWWKPADYSLAMLGANMQIEDQLSLMLCVVNAPGNDMLTNEQTRLFQAAARHIARAVRIHRQLWTLDHLDGSTPERFEGLRQGAGWAHSQGRMSRHH